MLLCLYFKQKFEDDATIKEKAATLAKWISTSKHVVVHTGAGISTSAGIPDFRYFHKQLCRNQIYRQQYQCSGFFIVF